MIAVYLSTIVEGALVLLLSWGAAYTLRASGIFSDVVRGINYIYTLDFNQVYILLIILISLLGIFLIFALGLKGLKWFIIPLVATCIPSAISHSGLPAYLQSEFDIVLDIPILISTMSLGDMLVIILAMVAGFVVLYQMVSSREMSDHLTWRGVDDSDISGAYVGRSITIIVIVAISVAASYLVSHYSSYMKGVFEESISLSNLLYLVVGIAGGVLAIVIILLLVVTQRPKVERVAPQPKKFSQKVATEVGAIAHIFVPSALTKQVGKALAFIGRSAAKAGRRSIKREKHQKD
jgi:hypothetical protein